MIDRLARLRVLLDQHQLDALFVSDPFNRRYLSGFSGSNGFLLIDRDQVAIATDFRYWDQVAGECGDWTLFKAVGPFSRWIGSFLAGRAGRRIGFEEASLTYYDYHQVVAALGALPAGSRPQFVPAPSLVEQLRMVKDADEIVALERAVALGDAAFAHAASLVEPGWTELQVARAIESYIRDHGGQGVSFPTIVAGGPRGALPHARAGEAVLRKGQGVVIDMGALLDGYCSDMTRTIYVGAGEPDATFRAVYDIVLAAQLTAEELIEPGMTGDQAHKLAQRLIDETGHGEHFGHGLGHGIGLQVHEAPWLRLDSTDVLADGQVFSVEPGIYLTGWGGVRIEDLVVLEHGRCRVLSKSPKVRVAGKGVAP